MAEGGGGSDGEAKEFWSLPDIGEVDLETAIDKNPFGMRFGELENGFRYYVKQNPEPKDEIIVCLLVKGGSSVEEEAEHGLAHLMEHLAFTATQGYQNQEANEFLENMKAMGGPHCWETCTNMDNTVFSFKVGQPKLSAAIAALAEISTEVQVSENTLVIEKGVVQNELDIRSANPINRLCRALDILKYTGSKYVPSSISREKEIVGTISVEHVNNFYRSWYNLQGMAIIIVGDFHGTEDDVLQIAESHFGQKKSMDDFHVLDQGIPTHSDPRFLCYVDPELHFSIASISFGVSFSTQTCVYDLYEELAEYFFYLLLNHRFKKLHFPSVDFVVKRASDTSNAHFYELSAYSVESEIIQMVEVILTEVARIRVHGFTDLEVIEAQTKLLKECEHLYQIKHGLLQSRYFVDTLIKHVSNGIAVLDPNFEAQLQKSLTPRIIVSGYYRRYTDILQISHNCSIMTAERKESVKEDDLQILVERVNGLVKGNKIDKWVEEEWDVSDPISEILSRIVPGEVEREFEWPMSDAHELHLSNGMRIFIKRNDGEDDAADWASLWGSAYGGFSDICDSDFLTRSKAMEIAIESQLYEYDGMTEMIPFNVCISEYVRTFNVLGFSSQLIEFALAAVYMLFTNNDVPKADLLEQVSKITKAKYKSVFPRLEDYVGGINGVHKPVVAEDIEKVDIEESIQFFNKCFLDPSSFVLIIAGKFDFATLQSHITSFLGGIPKTTEPIYHFSPNSLTAVPFAFPKNVYREEIVEEITGTSGFYAVRLSFPLELQNETMDKEKIVSTYLMNLIRTTSLRSLRFEGGQTYTATVRTSYNGDCYSSSGVAEWVLEISFTGTDKDKKKPMQMVDTMLEELEHLWHEGPSEGDLFSAIEAHDGVEPWTWTILKAFRARGYDGDIDASFKTLSDFAREVRDSLDVSVAKAFIQRMIPTPFRERYTAVAIISPSNDPMVEEGH